MIAQLTQPVGDTHTVGWYQIHGRGTDSCREGDEVPLEETQHKEARGGETPYLSLRNTSFHM